MHTIRQDVKALFHDNMKLKTLRGASPLKGYTLTEAEGRHTVPLELEKNTALFFCFALRTVQGKKASPNRNTHTRTHTRTPQILEICFNIIHMLLETAIELM